MVGLRELVLLLILVVMLVLLCMIGSICKGDGVGDFKLYVLK